MLQDEDTLEEVEDYEGQPISTPTTQQVRAVKKGYLPISNLSKRAKEAHIVKEIGTNSLISLGQLCDDNCKIQLDRHSLIVTKNNKIILTGYRNFNDGLYDIPLPTPIPSSNSNTTASINLLSVVPNHQKMLVILRKKQTQLTLATYLQPCFTV